MLKRRFISLIRAGDFGVVLDTKIGEGRRCFPLSSSKRILRWQSLPAAAIRADSLILLAPALCLHVPATLSKSKYRQGSISVRHVDWILLQENKSHRISLASFVPRALCCFRAAVCVCRRMVMRAATFSWKYCSVPSSLASGQQLFFFFFSSIPVRRIWFQIMLKDLAFLFFFFFDTAPNKYFPLAKTLLIFSYYWSGFYSSFSTFFNMAESPRQKMKVWLDL